MLLEDDTTVLKWFKPGPDQSASTTDPAPRYEPDFIVETVKREADVRTQAREEMTDPDVLDKAEAAATWCGHATNHELKNGGKTWTYLLIPHDRIDASKTLAGLIAAHTVTPK